MQHARQRTLKNCVKKELILYTSILGQCLGGIKLKNGKTTNFFAAQIKHFNGFFMNYGSTTVPL